jgi:hypothetical protein
VTTITYDPATDPASTDPLKPAPATFVSPEPYSQFNLDAANNVTAAKANPAGMPKQAGAGWGPVLRQPIVASGPWPYPTLMRGTLTRSGSSWTLPVSVRWNVGTRPSALVWAKLGSRSVALMNPPFGTAGTVNTRITTGRSTAWTLYLKAGNGALKQQAGTARKAVIVDLGRKNYGSFKATRVRGSYGGYQLISTKRNATATFRVKGTSVAWVASTGKGRGTAYVYLDGKYQAKVSLAAKSGHSNVVVWASRPLSSGTPTVTIKVITSGQIVNIDALAVIG